MVQNALPKKRGVRVLGVQKETLFPHHQEKVFWDTPSDRMFWRNLQGGSKYIQVYPNAEGVGKAVTPNYQRCKCEEMYRAASTLCPTLPGSVATRDRGGVQMQRNIIAKFAPVVLQQNGKQNQYPKQQITCCMYCIVLSYFFFKNKAAPPSN